MRQQGWAAAVLAVVALTMLTLPESGAGEAVTFRLNWYWRGLHAPLALAKERGHFKGASGDIELLEGRGSATTLQLVANKSDLFGLVDGFTLVVGVARGLPVRSVATILNSSSYAVISLEESGIRTARDLEGKSVGVTPGDGLTQVWPAVVAVNRLRAESIRLVHMDPRAKGPSLTERRVDAVLGSAADQPIVLAQKGYRVAVLGFAELGVPAVGLTLVAHLDTIRERRELVRQVVAATIRGFDEARRDPEAAVNALTRLAPLVDADLARRQLPVDLSFLFSRANVEKRIGYGPLPDWEATVELVRRYLGVEPILPATTFHTYEFVE